MIKDHSERERERERDPLPPLYWLPFSISIKGPLYVPVKIQDSTYHGFSYADALPRSSLINKEFVYLLRIIVLICMLVSYFSIYLFVCLFVCLLSSCDKVLAYCEVGLRLILISKHLGSSHNLTSDVNINLIKNVWSLSFSVFFILFFFNLLC